MTRTRVPALRDLPLDELRARRQTARRRLELVRMRAPIDDPAAVQAIEALRSEVGDLTEELIRRYCEDLTLVDSLLGQPYARGASSSEAGER